MAKALLVNGAVDMGTADIPNFNEGWGRVNLSNVINNGVNMVYRESPVIFANTGEQVTLTVGVTDPTKPLKVTVAWTDAAGAVGANPALVNNLDLTVVNGATTYKGNTFTGGWSVAGGSADARNNLENVYVQNPAGSATITINATNIAGDAVLGNADPTDQGFSLVCYNCALNPDYTLAATPASLDYLHAKQRTVRRRNRPNPGLHHPGDPERQRQPGRHDGQLQRQPGDPARRQHVDHRQHRRSSARKLYDCDRRQCLWQSAHGLGRPERVHCRARCAGADRSGQWRHQCVRTPTFSWNAVAQAASYSIEVATDATFSTIVASASGLTSPTWTLKRPSQHQYDLLLARSSRQHLRRRRQFERL